MSSAQQKEGKKSRFSVGSSVSNSSCLRSVSVALHKRSPASGNLLSRHFSFKGGKQFSNLSTLASEESERSSSSWMKPKRRMLTDMPHVCVRAVKVRPGVAFRAA